MAPDNIDISGLLLAGGQGSRLGGRDKGLMFWQGKPVAGHLAALLKEWTREVLISCNRNQDVYQQWADRLVGDDAPGYPGPLAGILAGLRECQGTHLLVLPCDMPHIDDTLLKYLLVRARNQPHIPCLVRAGEQWHPLVCVIPRALLPELQSAWEAGQRSPLRWLAGQLHTVLQLTPEDPRLHNANTLADWSVRS